MSLYSMTVLLKAAEEHSCAVGAFSVSNLEMIRGAVRAAEEADTPIILQIAEVRLPHAPLSLIGPAMLAAAKQAKVPVAVHLDHGTTLDCIRKALDLGFTSVMFDGSALSMEENIRLTRQVIEMARPTGASVEAEIGVIGKTESGEDRSALPRRRACASSGRPGWTPWQSPSAMLTASMSARRTCALIYWKRSAASPAPRWSCTAAPASATRTSAAA